MPRRVFECLTYDTATATCTQSAWVERATFPEMSVSDAYQLLTATALVFTLVWGWRMLGRQAGPKG